MSRVVVRKYLDMLSVFRGERGASLKDKPFILGFHKHLQWYSQV